MAVKGCNGAVLSSVGPALVTVGFRSRSAFEGKKGGWLKGVKGGLIKSPGEGSESSCSSPPSLKLKTRSSFYESPKFLVFAMHSGSRS